MTTGRRKFLKLLGAGAAAAAFPPSIGRALSIPANRRTGTIADVEHIVILMQENRSFDHYFGTLHGVRGFGERFPIPVQDSPGISGKTVWYQANGSTDGMHVLTVVAVHGATPSTASFTFTLLTTPPARPAAPTLDPIDQSPNAPANNTQIATPDFLGSGEANAEVQLFAQTVAANGALGFTDFAVRVNHRGVLDGLLQAFDVPPELRVAALTALDKLDKIAEAGVREELVKAGLAADSIARLMEVVALTGSPQEVLDALRPTLEQTESGQTGLRELTEIFEALNAGVGWQAQAR